MKGHRPRNKGPRPLLNIKGPRGAKLGPYAPKGARGHREGIYIPSRKAPPLHTETQGQGPRPNSDCGCKTARKRARMGWVGGSNL